MDKYLFFEFFLDLEVDGFQKSLLLPLEFEFLPELLISLLFIDID